jgi:predicted transposase YbfD/YdcC
MGVYPDSTAPAARRHMSNQFDTLLAAMQLTDHKPISRAQLPLLLAKINGLVFAQLLFDWCGFVLDTETKKWFAMDGKELRGSIQKGHTRGEAVVSAVAHQDGQVLAQTYYCGTKESERPAVATLIESQHLAPQKLTLDALHLIPETLRLIHAAEGHYVVGLKSNQVHLYRTCTVTDLFGVSDYERVDKKIKKHGRIEQRRYRSFTLGTTMVATRWHKAGLCTLLCVVRVREKEKVVSEEVSYYVSNKRPVSQADADELFDAIRGHWGVEVMHHKRDVILSEDDLRTSKATINRLIGSLRTLVINLLGRITVKNMAAQLDTFADKFTTLIQFLTQQMVL